MGPGGGTRLADLARAVAERPDDPDARMLLGNALMDAERAADAIAAYRAGLALRADHAPTLYNLGNALLATGDFIAAEAQFRTASIHAPAHAGAHNNRGSALRALGRLEEAATAFRAALMLRPSLVGTHNNLGMTMLALHRPEDAAGCFGAALRLAPRHAESCNNMGGAMLALDQPETALRWFDRAVVLEPALLQAQFGRAMALLSLGRLREGFAAYEARWRDPKFRDGERGYGAPLWLGGGDVAGRTILLRAEQGLGDTIMFARYAPLLRARGARVVLEVQPSLARLLAPLADVTVATGADLPAHDLRTLLASLPHAFATELDTVPAAVPYLFARSVAGVRGPGLNVGLAFSGSAEHPDDALRSIPVSLFAPLFALPGVTYHVLQTEVRDDDEAALRLCPGLRRYEDELTDFTNTAALLASMDVIVSVDTSVAHLGGAMGRRAWILLQAGPDFRWMRESNGTPWYPTVRLFRQGAERRWEPVIAAVAASLRSWT